MDDLRSADVDFITIGQYMQPTKKHHRVDRWVTPDEFREYQAMAKGKGFASRRDAVNAVQLSCRRGFCRIGEKRRRSWPRLCQIDRASMHAARTSLLNFVALNWWFASLGVLYEQIAPYRAPTALFASTAI